MSRKFRLFNNMLSMVLILSFAATWAAAADKTSAEKEVESITQLKMKGAYAKMDPAFRQLQVVGTRKCIPVVSMFLTDEVWSHHARLVLEAMTDVASMNALRSAMDTAKGMPLVGIIGSVGYREDAQAVPQLAKFLESKDEQVAEAACAALGRIATDKAIDALHKSFIYKHPKSCENVVIEAGLRIAEKLIARGDMKRVGDIYSDLSRDRWPDHARLAAFSGRLSAFPDQSVHLITTAMTGDDALYRSVAIAHVATLKTEGAAKRLSSEIPNVTADAQVLLIEALANCNADEVRPEILKATSLPTTAARMAALKALGTVGDATCVETLCDIAAAGKSSEEQQSAVTTLEILPGEGVNDAITSGVETVPADAQPALIGTLVLRQATDMAPRLLDLAQDAEDETRVAIFKALVTLGTKDYEEPLLGILQEISDKKIKQDAERSIAQLCRKNPNINARSNAVLNAMKGTRDTETQASLIHILGAIGNARALNTVKAALSARDTDLRNAAVRALADWPDDSALDAQLVAFRNASSDVHRILLLRGCVRLLGQSGRSPQQTVKSYRELMTAAKRPDDKRLILAGLANVASPAALKVVAPCLDDPETCAEAELATVGIIQAIMGSAPDQAKAAAENLKKNSKNEEIRKQVNQVLEQINKFEDFIVGWQVAGPYMKDGQSGGQLFNVVFPPETGDASVAWRPLPVAKEKPWMLDLLANVGGNNRVAYARTWVQSPKTQKALLDMGIDDGVKAWLNGKSILKNNSSGAAAPGDEKVKISLKKGWNELMIEVVQHTSAWEFCARIQTPDGKKLPGLKVDAAHGGAATTTVTAKPEAPKVTSYVPDGDWTPIFNGKNLDGWNTTGNAVFSVKDGVLIGTQTTGKGGDIWTDAKYDNFEMRVTYQVKWPANTGFWFRHDGKRGYQYDVLKYVKPEAYSGTLYCPGKMFITANLNEKLENRDGWNEAALRAAGEEMTLWLNGTQTGKCTDSTLTNGTIGIQIHPGEQFIGMEVRIKKMEVRKLKAEK